MNRIKWFDAVRAFGLFLVLGYHLFYNLLPSGFLGVDIFFTFSGFLITALFLEEVRKKGDFDLPKYFKRRARRIILPLFLSVALTLPAVMLISPDFSVGISKQAASALSFTANWYNIGIGASYEAQLIPQIYGHTWSLAILMQFYVGWGGICALLTMLSKAVQKKFSNKQYIFVKRLVLLLSVLIAAGSYVYMQWLHTVVSDLNMIYFNTAARLFPFFIGSAAAVVWGMYPKQDKSLKKKLLTKHPGIKTAAFITIILVVIAAIVLVFSQHDFSDDFIYKYGFLFTPFLTVALIYSAHALHILTPQKKKEPRALTIAAEMSYDMYLYHWPIYIVLSALIMNNMVASLAALAASIVISALMVYGVEKLAELRSIKNTSVYKRVALAASSLVIICALAAGGFVISKAPVITSIKSDFTAGYITWDVSEIVSLRNGIAAAKDSPVINISLNSPLQASRQPWTALPQIPMQNTEPTGQTPEQLDQTPEPQEQTSEQLDQTTSTPDEQTTQPASTEPPPSPSPSPPPASPETSVPPPAPPETSAPPATTPTAESEDRPASIPAGVTVIGDSVPLGARTTMMNRISGCYVDAEEFRTVNQGLSLMRNMQSRNALREYVVIALGTNGTTNYVALFTQIIEAVNPGHRLIFVTPFDGRSNNNSILTNATAEWMRALPSEYEFVTIADWNSTASAQVEVLAGDKVHMGGLPSMELYSDVISAAIGVASQKPSK